MAFMDEGRKRVLLIASAIQWTEKNRAKNRECRPMNSHRDCWHLPVLALAAGFTLLLGEANGYI